MIRNEAIKILNRNLEDWGAERDSYPATAEEMEILIQGGATIVHLNKNNGDGTFSSKVLFGEKYFISSAAEYKL
ncbi:hypothetical protein COU00_03545 [Candidatus Falkowbacteria bacterium CG10_big_fil_rev_8_21_14_0_10_43_11]|uniref:Uncharacterized protein n=1 Tax=Candidatus Falkowbacteria bacterium CG10_big_fil_rev_8_21_14_0_10_43_11 TaxID=1974568 RepID=A0A2M6WLB9_9BACT|nr:MAG: hypothetical protein COU00_03545 [Candidatus Falkowbacteria bacterium CG10_big_fil_rev_8_21_14_0_10_43_11]